MLPCGPFHVLMKEHSVIFRDEEWPFPNSIRTRRDRLGGRNSVNVKHILDYDSKFAGGTMSNKVNCCENNLKDAIEFMHGWGPSVFCPTTRDEGDDELCGMNGSTRQKRQRCMYNGKETSISFFFYLSTNHYCSVGCWRGPSNFFFSHDIIGADGCFLSYIHPRPFRRSLEKLCSGTFPSCIWAGPFGKKI